MLRTFKKYVALSLVAVMVLAIIPIMPVRANPNRYAITPNDSPSITMFGANLYLDRAPITYETMICWFSGQPQSVPVVYNGTTLFAESANLWGYSWDGTEYAWFGVDVWPENDINWENRIPWVETGNNTFEVVLDTVGLHMVCGRMDGFTLVFVSGAVPQNPAPNLSAPTNLSIQGTILSWNAVAGATY